MHPETLDFDTLSHLTGYQRPADIERWCDQHGIRYFRCRAGLFTTTAAINAALGIYPNSFDNIRPKPKPLEF